MSTTTAPTRPDVLRAVRATYVAFILAGFAFASWASSIPQVRVRLHLSPGSLGLVLLAISVGSLLALPLAGTVVGRLGSRRTVAAGACVVSAGIVVAAIGYLTGVPVLMAGLFLLGFGNGAWDVAMNVQGADAERHLGRAIMPRFHAGYSIGTVAGALVGAGTVALHVPVTAHLIGSAVVCALAVPFGVRGFLPDTQPETVTPDGPPTSALTRWRETRTLLIGLVVLAFAFCEGTGNDWIGVSLIDSYHAPAAVGTLGFATFLAAMTLGRWFGPPLLDRYGRSAVVRTLAGLAIGGLALFILGPSTPLAFLGAVLWGIGASLGFPVGMSAAADDPAASAARVSVVASIGYCAFLGGPPLIGFLGDHVTVLRALTAVGVLLAAAVLLAGSLRPQPAAPERAGAPSA